MKPVINCPLDEPYPGEEDFVPSPHYVLVPDDARIVRVSDVVRELERSGLRSVANIYNTSPSTLSRFLRRNGVKFSRTWQTPSPEVGACPRCEGRGFVRTWVDGQRDSEPCSWCRMSGHVPLLPESEAAARAIHVAYEQMDHEPPSPEVGA